MNSSGKGKKRRSTNGELRSQLSHAISLRSSEDQVLWTISGIFWAANALLLVALFQGRGLPESNVPRFVVPGVGVALSTMQYFLQGRALGHIGRYEELMKRLESALNVEPAHAVSADLSGEYADHYLGRHRSVLNRLRRGTVFPARALMQRASLAGGLLWLATLGFFVVTSVCSR